MVWFILLFAVFGTLTPWVGARMIRRSRAQWREYDRANGLLDDDDDGPA